MRERLYGANALGVVVAVMVSVGKGLNVKGVHTVRVVAGMVQQETRGLRWRRPVEETPDVSVGYHCLTGMADEEGAVSRAAT